MLPKRARRAVQWAHLIGHGIDKDENWHGRAVPGVECRLELGRSLPVRAGGSTVPQHARYSWTKHITNAKCGVGSAVLC